jgi:hypothetical protein
MHPRLTLFLLALVAVVGCSSDKAKPREIGTAAAYIAIVNWELGQLGPPATNASLPVIYIAADDGKTIDAGVQANVVHTTVDQAKVRFTDVRDDAIDTGVDGKPVKDDGVLLIVDKIDGKGHSRLEVPVTVYRSETDQQRTTLTLVATTDGALVTSVSSLPSPTAG